MPNPPQRDYGIFEINISEHGQYSSSETTMGKFSVTFTRFHVNRAISLYNNGQGVAEITNSSPKLHRQPFTIAVDPHNNGASSLLNINFSLQVYLHLDQNVREDVIRSLQEYMESNPRPSCLLVSITRIREYVIGCSEHHQEDGEQSSERRKRRRLDSDTSKLPKKIKKLKEEAEEYLCSICLENMNEEENVKLTFMPCSHGFHDHCLTKWLKTRPSYPLCRFELGNPCNTRIEVQSN